MTRARSATCRSYSTYGERRIADQLAANWRGGAYVAFKRAQVAVSPSTGDVALLYVSHWKSEKAAQFSEIYGKAVAARYQKPSTQGLATRTDANCPLWRREIGTEEGPIIVELWPENTVIVSESFDGSTAARSFEMLYRRQAPACTPGIRHRRNSVRACASCQRSADFKQISGKKSLGK
jgi:hypothetical protein